MIAFLVFLILMIAFSVGFVRISMYLYTRNCLGHSGNHQSVTLKQGAFIARSSYKERRSVSEIGMGQCLRRIGGISVVVLATMILLIMVFVNAAH